MGKPTDINLVQLTDTHIFADHSRRMRGVDTFRSLNEVLALVKEREHPDYLVLTGDLSHDETRESYRRLADLLGGLQVPAFFLAGNHDDQSNLLEVFELYSFIRMERSAVVGRWLLVFLDSTIPGRIEGALGFAELERLDRLLAEHGGDKHVLVFLHHNPVTMEENGQDCGMLLNPEPLFQRLEGSCVRGVIWGHVHQEYSKSREGLQMMATPSTCVQFRPAPAGIAIDAKAPAYRRLRLSADGAIESAVCRTDSIPAGLELSR